MKHNENEEIQKQEEDIKDVKARERKMDLDEYYVVEDGEADIDILDQKEVLKSSMPMILTVKEDKRKVAKVAKNKVKDVISKNINNYYNFLEKKQ